MSEKQRSSIIKLINISLLVIGLGFYFLMHISIYYLFAILLLSPIIANLIGMFLPVVEDKKKSGSSQKKKTATQKKNSISKTANKSTKQPSTTSEVPHNRLLPDDQILQLDLKDMSWREIEQLVYLFYTAKGYKPELTKAGADGGIDLIYQNPEHGKTAVQIKQYIGSERQIDVKLIRELDAAKKNYKCVFSEFITTTTFTNPASAEKPPGMDLKDIRWFNRQVTPWMEKERKKRKLA